MSNTDQHLFDILSQRGPLTFGGLVTLLTLAKGIGRREAGVAVADFLADAHGQLMNRDGRYSLAR